MLIQKQCTIARLEGKNVILQLDSGQEIALPKEDFPKGVQVGEELTLKIQPAHEAKLDQQELARTLLNQIITHDPPQTQTPS